MRGGRADAEPDAGALARGDFAAARAGLERALETEDSAETRQALAALCVVLEDLDAARRHGEAAYRRFRDAGDLRGAARAAITIASVHEWAGNEAGTGGWLARARRLLDDAGECVERGYLELARIGCEVRDVHALEASATIALETARRFRDTDLEVRALADSGLALVAQGRVAEGLSRLDEAMAAVVAGEVRSHFISGTSCCAMLHACDRLGDLERARHWTDAVFDSARDRFGDPPPVVLQAHCRVMLGAMLTDLGRWDEAEAEFRRAHAGTSYFHYRADASARLADLRVRQGRLAEAAELLAGFEDSVEAAAALARLSVARGEASVGVATLRRALRQFAGDRLSRAPLLGLLVEIEAGCGRADTGALAELREIATTTDVPAMWALYELSSGRTAPLEGRDPVAHLQSALARLPQGFREPLRADIQMELAAALRSSDPAAAVAEAKAALAMFERLGARRSAGRAAALLRELGVSARLRGDVDTLTPLSRREREVLDLLALGLSNAEIAARLFITPKTAEHHVGAILGKLNVRTRAEAAVVAAGLRDAVTP